MNNNNLNSTSPFKVLPGFKNNDKCQSPDDIISITKMNFLSQELSTYEELFRGYNELRVITYSYTLSFIEKVMHYFDRGEVILGFDKLIHKNTADLFALQEFSTNFICHNEYLQKRINDDEFRFYVLNDLISHQKIYLLKADDGRVRTITGSANFSEGAWTGEQIECVIVCDDPVCYEIYSHQYETLQQFATDEISKDAVFIDENGENVDELPIFKQIKYDTAVVLHDIHPEEESEYLFHRNKLDKKWEDRLKDVSPKSSKDGKIILDTKYTEKLLGTMRKATAIKREHELINPQFILDFDNHAASYNQTSFDLMPDPDAVSNDLKQLIEYMDGFDLFTKDTFRLKTSYWKVLNYMFLPPFIARLRYEGSRYCYEDCFFPMYMLIYGDSDAGKTGFVNLTRKLMFNEKMNSLKQNNFSSKPMTALKTDVKGCPILIDELTPTYWKYAKDIVKMDSTLISERLIHHPTFVLLSNDITNVAPELSKRIIIISLDNRLDRTIAAYNGKKVNTILRHIDNALYCEYLRRMFNAVDKLIEELQKHDEQNTDEWIPDIFEVSSQILIDIMNDFNIDIPAEFHTFTWFDYMGDAAIGEKATAIIKDEYIHNPSIFHINSSKNILELDFSCYDSNESKKKLRILHDELPADVECKIVGTKAILKLDSIKKHTGINFKKKPFWRIK